MIFIWPDFCTQTHFGFLCSLHAKNKHTNVLLNIYNKKFPFAPVDGLSFKLDEFDGPVQ